MAYKYKNLNIEKLSVIGAGQIGPDICLHFAKMFWKNKVTVLKEDVGGSVNRTITLNVGTGQVKLKVSGIGEVML